MRTRAFLGLALLLAALPAAAQARGDSQASGTDRTHTQVMHYRWGPCIDGRWYAGWQAPGGWAGYRPPARGQVVPYYWVSPSYHVGDYATYGLGRPGYGLAWSRYYDDAVLIDGRGYVYDVARGVDWNGHNNMASRREDGMGGAIIGGTTGAIVGNRIAGRERRAGGTLIGAGLGALAGMAIDKAEDGEQGSGTARLYPYNYDFGQLDERVTGGGERGWNGAWQGPAGIDYGMPVYPAYGYGYAAAYAVPMMATVMLPVTTTTTTYVEEEVVETAARKVARPRPKRAYKPRPKPRCVCK